MWSLRSPQTHLQLFRPSYVRTRIALIPPRQRDEKNLGKRKQKQRHLTPNPHLLNGGKFAKHVKKRKQKKNATPRAHNIFNKIQICTLRSRFEKISPDPYTIFASRPSHPSWRKIRSTKPDNIIPTPPPPSCCPKFLSPELYFDLETLRKLRLLSVRMRCKL